MRPEYLPLTTNQLREVKRLVDANGRPLWQINVCSVTPRCAYCGTTKQTGDFCDGCGKFASHHRDGLFGEQTFGGMKIVLVDQPRLQFTTAEDIIEWSYGEGACCHEA